MTATRADAKLAQKPKRVPMGRRDVLNVFGADDPNFVRRWMNDRDDRLHRALEAGYSFVDSAGATVGDVTPETARGSGSIMSKKVGAGVTAYLMKIPKEWYDADQAAKDKNLDDLEAQMKVELMDKSKGRYGRVEFSVKDHA